MATRSLVTIIWQIKKVTHDTVYWQSVAVTGQCTLNVATEHGQSVNQQFMMADQQTNTHCLADSRT